MFIIIGALRPLVTKYSRLPQSSNARHRLWNGWGEIEKNGDHAERFGTGLWRWK